MNYQKYLKTDAKKMKAEQDALREKIRSTEELLKAKKVEATQAFTDGNADLYLKSKNAAHDVEDVLQGLRYQYEQASTIPQEDHVYAWEAYAAEYNKEYDKKWKAVQKAAESLADAYTDLLTLVSEGNRESSLIRSAVDASALVSVTALKDVSQLETIESGMSVYGAITAEAKGFGYRQTDNMHSIERGSYIPDLDEPTLNEKMAAESKARAKAKREAIERNRAEMERRNKEWTDKDWNEYYKKLIAKGNEQLAKDREWRAEREAALSARQGLSAT